MNECTGAFAFGLTGIEFFIICLGIAFIVGCFCAMVSYLEGPSDRKVSKLYSELYDEAYREISKRKR